MGVPAKRGGAKKGGEPRGGGKPARGGAGGKKGPKKGPPPAAVAQGKGKKKQLPHEGNVYNFDEDEEAGGERRKKDDLRRFAGVEVYDYEQPEEFEDDEEIDEDEAFNDEDLAMYGDLGGGEEESGKGGKGGRGGKKRSKDDGEDEGEGGEEGSDLDGIFDESGEEVDEDDDEGGEEEDEEDEEEYQRMLAAVRAKGDAEEEEDGAYQQPAAGENEFHVAAGTQGVRAAGKLSLGSLLAGVKDDKGLRDVAKSLEKVRGAKPVAVPVPTVIASRAARETGYEETSRVVSEWQPVVKQNREKEQIRFPLKDPGRINVSSSSLAASFKPRGTLEEEIAASLKASGADEETLRKTEQLEMRKLSVEEVKERQAELARMRSLLFHAEVRAKRINKIKSKKFRKVDRKYKGKAEAVELEQLKDLDPEEYERRVMEAERKRAQERVSLKHKNTSKWVKHMLSRGHGEGEEGNDGSRQAIIEQLRLGEELRKKVLDEGEGSESEDDGDVDQLKREIEEGPLAGLSAQAQEKAKKGVYGMAFMQRAEKEKKEQALQQLKELEAMERGEGLSDESDFEEDGATGMRRKSAAPAEDSDGYHDSDDEGEGGEAHAQQPNTRAAKRKAATPSAERKPLSAADRKVLEDGGMSLDSVVFGGGSSTAVSGFTTVYEHTSKATPTPTPDAKAGKKSAKKAKKEAKASDKDPSLGVVPPMSANGLAADPKATGKRKSGAAAAEPEEGPAANPWLAPPSAEKKAKKGGAAKEPAAAPMEAGENPWLVPAEKKHKVDQKQGKKGVVSEGTKQHEHVAKLRAKGDKDADSALLDADVRLGDGGEGEGEDGQPVMMSEPTAAQRKLMKSVFIDADVEEEFRHEKEQILDASKPKVVAATPGWGGWGGDGVREWEKAKKRLEVSHKKTKQDKLNALMNADVDPAKRKDKNLDHVIITERRNKKGAKYLVEKQPYQYSTKEQYESAMRQPIGPDWNTSLQHKKAIAKAVVVKTGKIIEPIQKPTSKKCKANMLSKMETARPTRPVQ